jgi:DNA-binding NarL/FixJ family response regulator
VNQHLLNVESASGRSRVGANACLLLSAQRPGLGPERNFNALIVDDNEAMRQWLRQVMTRRFPAIPVSEATDGESALRRVAAQSPDLVFMDIRLPGKSGLDVTRIIKSIRRQTKVCVITNFNVPEYRDAAFDSGADHFFVKDAMIETDIVAIVDAIVAGETSD